MKRIFCRFIVLLAMFWLTACSTLDKSRLEKQRTFRITHADSAGQMVSETWTKEKLEALGMKIISNEYFDRAMHWSESRFSAINFSLLLKRFTLKSGQDAVLLNCFDDYQGILSLDDIYRYDLRLATKITLTPKHFKPDWLHPLLILVPDGKRPPFQERFMTANMQQSNGKVDGGIANRSVPRDALLATDYGSFIRGDWFICSSQRLLRAFRKNCRKFVGSSRGS